MINLGIFGATGRFGKRIAACALQHPSFRLQSAMGRSHHGEDLGTLLGGPSLGLPISSRPDPLPDLFIDASLAAGLSDRLQYGRPIVIGTTGLSPKDFDLIQEASRKIPLFYAPNFSLGIALLRRCAAEIAKQFPLDASIDLIETHHTEKKDAPSGAALTIADAVRKEKPEARIEVHSIRSGKIIGEHSLQFNNADERIQISHQAHSRDVFAKGALAAALFLIDQPPGLYGMDDLLNVSQKLAGRRD